MRCPVDGEDLTALPQVNGAAHTCELCGGLWLDAHALHALGARVPVGRSNDSPRDARSCSRCEQGMTRLTANELEIDLCPGCRGIWLDAGELESLKAGRGSVGPRDRLVPEAGSGDSEGSLVASVATDVAVGAVNVVAEVGFEVIVNVIAAIFE